MKKRDTKAQEKAKTVATKKPEPVKKEVHVAPQHSQATVLSQLEPIHLRDRNQIRAAPKFTPGPSQLQALIAE